MFTFGAAVEIVERFKIVDYDGVFGFGPSYVSFDNFDPYVLTRGTENLT